MLLAIWISNVNAAWNESTTRPQRNVTLKYKPTTTICNTRDPFHKVQQEMLEKKTYFVWISPWEASEVLAMPTMRVCRAGQPFPGARIFCLVIRVLAAHEQVCSHYYIFFCRFILIKICLKIRRWAEDVTQVVECLTDMLKSPESDPQNWVI